MFAETVIPMTSIAAIAAGLVLLLVGPSVLLVVLGVRKKLTGLPLALGFVSFFVSQILLRIPMLSVMSASAAVQGFASAHALLYTFVVGGLSAGLFEETARLGGAMILKRERSHRDAVSFGLGHGLCEVMVLIGINYINLLVLSVMTNASPAMMEDVLGAEQFALVVDQLCSVTPTAVFWAVIERVGAVLLHIFNTVLVFRAVRDKKPVFYFAALALHTIFNFAASVLASTFGVAVCEIVLLAVGLACGWGVLKARAWFEAPSEHASA